MNDKERMKLLNTICDLSGKAAVSAESMNSVRTPTGYILTITNLCTRDDNACSEFLKSLEGAGLSITQPHPVSIRTVYVTNGQQSESGV